jgi:CheY-like chemotaxis protein
MIAVAIIEDNRLVCECMTDMLNKVPDVNVVLAATSLETAMLKEANPRVVLLDIGLPDTNCLHVAETVRKEMPDSRVIVMDLHPVHEEIAQFVNVGVAGFTLKDATFEDFVGTIRSVADGARVLPSRMTDSLFLPDRAGGPSARRVGGSRGGAHDAERTRGDRAHRGRDEQQGNRDATQHLHRHGEEPRAERDGEARPSYSAADLGLRARPGRIAARSLRRGSEPFQKPPRVATG